jgi:uncharacterized protein YdeI (YjbR/CyaY-like superfamily)
MHAGRNVAIIGALRGDFRLTFFNAALLDDPDHLLERQGPNARVPDMMRFADEVAVAAREPAIRALLAQAKGHAATGRKPPKEDAALVLPADLAQAMEADAELAKAVHRLTRGRQKSYVLNLNAAKTPATRLARIARFRPAILAGKGALDR